MPRSYDRGVVALRVKALSLAAPDDEALAWVWETFSYGLCTLEHYSTQRTLPPTVAESFGFEYEMLCMLSRAWGMNEQQFDEECERASIEQRVREQLESEADYGPHRYREERG